MRWLNGSIWCYFSDNLVHFEELYNLKHCFYFDSSIEAFLFQEKELRNVFRVYFLKRPRLDITKNTFCEKFYLYYNLGRFLEYNLN